MYGDRDHQETGNSGKGKNNSGSNILETVEEEDEDDIDEKYLEAMKGNDTLLDFDDIEDAEDVAGFEFVDHESDEDDYVI